MSTPVVHDTFVLERAFRADRRKAFNAWADFDQKAKWFAGPAGRWTAVRRELDFSIGGTETVVGDFDGHGTSGFFATYLDIVDQERIIYSYRMYVDEVLYSISLVTVEFYDEGTGSKTVFTEQGAYFGSREDAVDRKVGSEMLLDNIACAIDET